MSLPRPTVDSQVLHTVGSVSLFASFIKTALKWRRRNNFKQFYKLWFTSKGFNGSTFTLSVHGAQDHKSSQMLHSRHPAPLLFSVQYMSCVFSHLLPVQLSSFFTSFSHSWQTPHRVHQRITPPEVLVSVTFFYGEHFRNTVAVNRLIFIYLVVLHSKNVNMWQSLTSAHWNVSK